MTADQVTRCAIIKQTHQFSYEKLEFHLGDSLTFRSFCRLPFGETPSSSCLQANIARIRPSTWESINRALVKWAVAGRLESGRQVRIDSTAVETDIHHPLDSALLADSVRALTRRMKALGSKRTLSPARHRLLGTHPRKELCPLLGTPAGHPRYRARLFKIQPAPGFHPPGGHGK